MDYLERRSAAISSAINTGEQYGLSTDEAASLLSRVDDEFYLHGDESGSLVINGYEYFNGDIEESS